VGEGGQHVAYVVSQEEIRPGADTALSRRSHITDTMLKYPFGSIISTVDESIETLALEESLTSVDSSKASINGQLQLTILIALYTYLSP
jgi:hypothetical protein